MPSQVEKQSPPGEMSSKWDPKKTEWRKERRKDEEIRRKKGRERWRVILKHSEGSFTTCLYRKMPVCSQVGGCLF